MHSLDRRWRWFMGIAIGPWLFLPLLGVILAWTLQVPLTPAIILKTLDWSQFSENAPTALLSLGMAMWARGSRRRERLRARALAGELDVMPPAIIAPDPTRAPDLSREPLALLWRKGRRSTGVVATNEGLLWRRPRRRDVLLPWKDARLLEAVSWTGWAGYCLYGGDGTYVEWIDFPEDKAPAATDGAPFEEVWRRQRALLDAIAARTGLMPRTLAPDLMMPASVETSPPSMTPGRRRSGLRRLSPVGTLFLITLAVLPLAAAAGVLVVPLTRSFDLNAYAAATIGGLGLFVLGFDVKALAAILRDMPLAPLPAITFPAAPSGLGDTFTLRYPAGWRGRLVAIAVGLLLAGNAYPLFHAIVDFGPAFGSERGDPLYLHHLVAVSVALTVFVGMCVCDIVAFARRAVVSADDAGLRWREGKRHLSVPWDGIVALAAHVSSGRVKSFEAIADDANHTSIRWPVGSRWVAPRDVSAAGAAAEMAALVAQRTGISLTIVRDA